VIPLLNVDVNLANKTKSSDLRTNGSGEGDSATDISSVDETESIGTDDSDNISTLPSLDDDDDLEVHKCRTFVVLLTPLCLFVYLLEFVLLFCFNISSFNILHTLLPLFKSQSTHMCVCLMCNNNNNNNNNNRDKLAEMEKRLLLYHWPSLWLEVVPGTSCWTSQTCPL
jgi:hypothetical protein